MTLGVANRLQICDGSLEGDLSTEWGLSWVRWLLERWQHSAGVTWIVLAIPTLQVGA